MRTIPAYVVTGFLDAGKTTFLNHLFARPDMEKKHLLLIQFESGEAAFECASRRCAHLRFSKRELDTDAQAVTQKIRAYLLRCKLDELWIEWNGVTPLAVLQGMFAQLPPSRAFSQETLGDLCRIKRVLHVADAKMLKQLLGHTGSPLVEQVASSDVVALRNANFTSPVHRQIKKLLHGLNPGVAICPLRPIRRAAAMLYRKKIAPAVALCIGAALFFGLYFFARAAANARDLPLDTIISVFLGILLQAIPFLFIGVLLSSAIQVFVPPGFIEKHFPKRLVPGILFAVLGGFCLPVCDCASIPVFRSLLRKNVPLPSAVIFMAAAPVINPVVILSTFYAFNGSWKIVCIRIGLGVLSAILVGLSFAACKPGGPVLSDGDTLFLCRCGCYEADATAVNRSGKLLLFLRHSQMEFWTIGKYLIIGALVSALFQTINARITWMQTDSNLAVSLLLMMGMAFFISLCSSSDAVVARSLSSQFPFGAILGFLVFGPMMDIKNIILLSSGFSGRFIRRLSLTVFVVCFAVVYGFSAILFKGGMG